LKNEKDNTFSTKLLFYIDLFFHAECSAHNLFLFERVSLRLVSDLICLP